MASVDTELALVALAAMLSPTTLSFSVLALVLGERPLRTGLWFYLGAFGVTLLIGVAAAFVLGDVAAAPAGSSTPKTWVCIVDILAGAALLVVIVRFLRRPSDSARMDRHDRARWSPWPPSPAIAIVAAGADPRESRRVHPAGAQGHLPDRTHRRRLRRRVGRLRARLAAAALARAADARIRPRADQAGDSMRARGWLERHAMTLAAAILALLALALLRNGIAGLTG